MTNFLHRSLPTTFLALLFFFSAQAQITGPATVCKGTTVTHSFTGSISGLTYHWTINPQGNITGVTTSVAASTATVTWGGSGTGLLTVKSYNGTLLVDSVTKEVTILDKPEPYLTSDFQVACQTYNFDTAQDKRVPEILDDSSGCVKVCEYSTVVYTAPELSGTFFERKAPELI